jgi:L-ascorbate metabolism protein UlaG (beta-lactamase superfamily)
MKQGTFEGATITALGHAGFVIEFAEKKLRIAFDPYDIKEEQPVDYIFVSHQHFDHCDPVSIRKLLKNSTRVIAPACCEQELSEFGQQLELLKDKEKHKLKQCIYWALPAYNVNKFRTPNEVFHPKDMGGVGFVVEVDGFRMYHAGDTDRIPEMDGLKKLDLAFLPISGTFVMTLEEAIEAAQVLKPKMVIPMHFGKLLGSVGDANRYHNMLRDLIPVMVLTDAAY